MWVTRFSDLFSTTFVAEEMTLKDLAGLIDRTEQPTKPLLPMLKLARFGGQPSAQGALRNDGNLLAVTGVEGDYDDEQMPVGEAVKRLDNAGIAFIVYTSPSHDPLKPRWRVLCPLATEHPPAARRALVDRLNGILGGGLARESWTLSQAYYFGRVDGAPFELYVGDHEPCLDDVEELDAGALGFQPGPGQGPSTQSQGAQGKTAPDFKQLDEHALLDLIRSAAYYFRPVGELARRWARQQVAETTALGQLDAALDDVPPADRNKKWRDGKKRLAGWVKQMYQRAGRSTRLLRALVDHLGNVPPWPGTARLNTFIQQLEVVEPYPPKPGQALDRWRPLRDPEDILRVVMAMQDIAGFERVGKNLVRDALSVVAGGATYHPVQDYLRGLTWDEKPRVGLLFTDYFPCELPDPHTAPDDYRQRTAYYAALARTALIGAVARALEPGCQLDTMVVLIGAQGWLKSSGIRALAPTPEWFTDDVSTALIDRDTKESLLGKWLVELSEFPHLRRESDKLKAFVSRRADRFRRAYERVSQDWPRSCLFWPTVNELTLSDYTGNRRYLPAPMAAPADLKAIVADRDMLWAEAVHLYHQGTPWWLGPEAELTAAELQGDYLESSAWEERVAEWLTGRGDTAPFTTRQVLLGLGFGFDPGERNRATRADEMLVAGCLKRLGYRIAHCRINGTKGRWWLPAPKRFGLASED
jgi:hypothetical protein